MDSSSAGLSTWDIRVSQIDDGHQGHHESSDAQLPSQYYAISDIVTCSICLDHYDNPITIECSHTYCQHCLMGISHSSAAPRTTHERCPQCRRLTVPPCEIILQLPTNSFVQALVQLVVGGTLLEKSSSSPELSELNCDDNAEPLRGELMPGLPQKEKKTRGQKIASIAARSLMAMTTIGIGNYIMNRKASAKRKKVEEEYKRLNPYLMGFHCHRCDGYIKYNLQNEVRYKCGFCEDFNLCDSCATTVPAIESHRVDHIFIKLKFKQMRKLPAGPLLKLSLMKNMVESSDFDNTHHGPVYIHTPERLVREVGIRCSECSMIISGIRYKCGMCCDYDLCSQCEHSSTVIHDPNHVFLVLPHRMAINFVEQSLIKAYLY